MTHRPSVSLLAVLAVSATVAHAHDTWLLPIKGAVTVGEAVQFDATSAMDFPAPEVAMSPERLVVAQLRVAGGLIPLQPEKGSAKALRLSARPSSGGVATAWFEGRPREIDMKSDRVGHYLEEAGAIDTVGKEWEQAGRPAWHETYSKIAKAFVRVGSTTDRSWAEPTGAPFEMVPETDPTALRAGDVVTIRVLENGAPLGAQAVTAVAPGAKPDMRRTDAAGRVSFTVGQPGPWLVRAVHIQPDSAKPGAWRSRFTTLTLIVDAVPAATGRQETR